MRRTYVPFEREEAKFLFRVVEIQWEMSATGKFFGDEWPNTLDWYLLCLWVRSWRNESVVALTLKELRTNLSIKQEKWGWDLFRLVFVDQYSL